MHEKKNKQGWQYLKISAAKILDDLSNESLIDRQADEGADKEMNYRVATLTKIEVFNFTWIRDFEKTNLDNFIVYVKSTNIFIICFENTWIS